ncbi:MAG: hypothetical protein ACOH2H_20865 [Cypionkella sp.]
MPEPANVPGLPPDHAGLFETTLHDGLAGGRIDLPRLGTTPDRVGRFDPASPLWGIVGADPRQSSPLGKEALVRHMVAALTEVAGSS